MADHTDKRTDDDAALAAFFTAARETPPDVSDDLFAAIVSDAANHRPDTKTVLPGEGLLAALRDTLGGWRSLAGLTTAAVAGLAIGVISPDPLSFLEQGIAGTFIEESPDAVARAGYDLADMMPDYAPLDGEGWP